ncbi:hypothetical protein LAG90_09205 [Marinilongibacter aquaticus]|uniref:hypothetical protein n=1 Tax=Marinilongibacter aquaticus TaxID=2975157 RepID=UPI0021BD1F78|nr:hypothetical protein [Marinilongibacter aquaticus]UBM60812.1 hypothetical protein LAG90_09205 [Marinilongibacter aquaticus]
MKIENEIELRALLKALNFIKYYCKDDDCTEIAASPVVNQVMKGVMEALEPFNLERGFEPTKNLLSIESYPDHIEVIKGRIKATPNWNKLALESKRAYVEDLIQPLSSGLKH